MPSEPTRLAVLGSPIAHSKSPLLHSAAYHQLGLDWQYDRVELAGDGLANFVASRDSSWRGVSLTMPLKRDILPLLDEVDDLVRVTGVSNTALFSADAAHKRTIQGFNTDVYGVTQALREASVVDPTLVHIIGAGATAASVLVAVTELGAQSAVVFARSPQKANHLVELGRSLGIDVRLTRFVAEQREADESREPTPNLVASTLPGDAGIEHHFSARTRAESVLFDVAYEPWPSAFAARWRGPVVSGLEMLVHQALAQVRVFVNGSPVLALPHEEAVLSAMRASIA